MSTATLTLINLDAERHPRALLSDEDVDFLVHLSLTDMHYVPPFLPAFTVTVNRRVLAEIKRWLRDIQKTYELCQRFEYERSQGVRAPKGLDYQSTGRKQVLDLVTDIGIAIYNFGSTTPLSAVINKISELAEVVSTDTVIIHTNDVSIPWQWLFVTREDTFLCEKYALGTIFCANPWAPNVHQWKPFNKAPSNWQRETPKALLLGGNLNLTGDPGDSEACDNQTINDQLSDIKELLQDPNSFTSEIALAPDYFDARDVTLLSKYSSEAAREIDVLSAMQKYIFESRNAENLKLFHYAGHFDQDKLVLDIDRTIGKDHFARLSLYNSPLFFLTCCLGEVAPNFTGEEEERAFGAWSPGSEFSAALLNQHACGVIVTLLPIHSSSHGFAREFYRSLLLGHQRIGTALTSARQQADRLDPERLFFQLYGDPRNHLFGSGY